MSKWKSLLRKLLYKMIHVCAPRKCIIFESVPDFSDNTRPVFDEMLRRGLDNKYTLVWFVSGKKELRIRNTNIKYINSEATGLTEKIRSLFYRASAKCLICCNRFLVTEVPGQVSFYLSHGTTVKNIRNYYTLPEGIDYCLAAAPGVAQLMAYQLKIDEKKMFALGFPRNDVFYKQQRDIKNMLETDCEKVIVWYPTFRKHKNGRRASTGNALPIIHDAQAAVQLNETARACKVLLVMKPHFAQDVQDIKELGLSNIRLIDDSFFEKNAISSYEFVGSCDALISDYSSVFFDYMLCDKPIALIWEDLEAYRQNPGFAIDLDAYTKGVQKVYTLQEFQTFIEEVSCGVDTYKAARRECRDVVNYATDGKNTQRVVDFIMKTAEL